MQKKMTLSSLTIMLTLLGLSLLVSGCDGGTGRQVSGDYWDYHGWLFLFGVMIFPRITTLFFTSVSFGFWAILGWIFTPHLLVAIYATIYYWDSNPFLCVMAWFVAFGGTSGEAAATKKVVS